jgi:hypothetical protein
MIEFPRYPRTELGGPDQCFTCATAFNGDTPAFHVVIELTKPEKEKTDERDTNL